MPWPKATLRKRVLAWTLVLTLYAIVAGMAIGAVVLIRFAFKSGTSLDGRLIDLSSAAFLLILPVRLSWIYFHKRWTTGRWLMTKEERAQQLSQCATRRNRPIQAPPYSWIRRASLWASYSAMETASPFWRRALGWTVLILFIAAQLGFAALGVIFIGAAFADGPVLLRFVLIALGGLMLLLPIQAMRSSILRRRTTGTWVVSREELQQLDAQRTEWRVRESQRPLSSKIISIVIMAVLLTGWWIRVTVHHSHQNWLNPAIWTVFAIYAIWVQFRKPKNSLQRTSDSSLATQL